MYILGWALYNCASGYTLDPAIGSLYICDNGVWSTKPRCLSMNDFDRILLSSRSFFCFKEAGHCSLSSLTTFLSTTTGLQSTGQIQIIRPPDDSTVVLHNSYAVFSCVSGYTNMGGSLNVTCNPNGTWSPFPNCATDAGDNSMSPATKSNAGTHCSVTSITFFVPYAFFTNTTAIILHEDNTASGMLMMLTDLQILFCVSKDR